MDNTLPAIKGEDHAPTMALLAWRWEENLETWDPDVDSPGRMLPEHRRQTLAEALLEAMNDGAEIEERR